MNIKSISTQLLYTTVPIWVQNRNGSQTSGTGFIYMHSLGGVEGRGIPFVVTNHHVVKDAQRVILDFAEMQGEEPVAGKRIRSEIPPEMVARYSNPQDDLAAMLLGPVLNQAVQSNRPIFFRPITKELIPRGDVMNSFAAIEEITFIGYPSGLFDQHNVTPIVRRGITATPVCNDFQNQPSFLIDAGVYPGSSGSPVFLFNEGGFPTPDGFAVGKRLFFLGVITETIIRAESQDSRVFLGLGRVLKSHRVQQFIESFVGDIEKS